MSPLVATQFAHLPRWLFHYLTSLGLALSNMALLAVVLRLKRQDGAHSTLCNQKAAPGGGML